MKIKNIFILASVMFFSFAPLYVLCCENDLVNYVLDASEQCFDKGVIIWQSPYKNLLSFQSKESRLYTHWLHNQQSKQDDTDH